MVSDDCTLHSLESAVISVQDEHGQHNVNVTHQGKTAIAYVMQILSGDNSSLYGQVLDFVHNRLFDESSIAITNPVHSLHVDVRSDKPKIRYRCVPSFYSTEKISNK